MAILVTDVITKWLYSLGYFETLTLTRRRPCREAGVTGPSNRTWTTGACVVLRLRAALCGPAALRGTAALCGPAAYVACRFILAGWLYMAGRLYVVARTAHGLPARWTASALSPGGRTAYIFFETLKLPVSLE